MAINTKQHTTQFNQNSVSTAYIAWRLNLTARQFIAETTFLGQTDVPPGGTFIPARRFLGENPEFS